MVDHLVPEEVVGVSPLKLWGQLLSLDMPTSRSEERTFLSWTHREPAVGIEPTT